MMWLAVALGGALGAMLRYSVSLFIPISLGSFPWATFIVNIVGSALIGLCYVLLVEKGVVNIQWRPFLMVGILGALTTFSTFALDTLLLWQQEQVGQAVLYAISSLIVCIAAAGFGMQLAHKFF